MAITFILIGISLGVILLDQIVKWVIALNLTPTWPSEGFVGESIEVIEGFFDITHLKNSGMSFGLFGEGAERWIFMIISPIALVAIGVYLFGFAKKEKLTMKLGLAFILGGGISNMIDRIFYGRSFFDNPWTIFENSFWDELFNGYVVDMFDFKGIWNAVFNVADSFVCIGAGLVICTLIYDLLVSKKEEKAQAEKKALEYNEKMNGVSAEDGVLLPENDEADIKQSSICIDNQEKEVDSEK